MPRFLFLLNSFKTKVNAARSYEEICLFFKKINSMKALLKSLFLFSIFLFPLRGDAQQEEIKKVLNKQAEAWNNGDIRGFMDGYWENDSLRFISKKGVTYGWKPVLENYVKSYGTKEKMGKLDFKEITVQVISDDAAFVVGHWKVSADIIQEGTFSLLFYKKNGKWVIVCDHTS